MRIFGKYEPADTHRQIAYKISWKAIFKTIYVKKSLDERLDCKRCEEDSNKKSLRMRLNGTC